MAAKDADGAYFFDRNADVFDIILNFYRINKILVPKKIPIEVVKPELEFFGLNVDDEGILFLSIIFVIFFSFSIMLFDSVQISKLLENLVCCSHTTPLSTFSLPLSPLSSIPHFSLTLSPHPPPLSPPDTIIFGFFFFLKI